MEMGYWCHMCREISATVHLEAGFKMSVCGLNLSFLFEVPGNPVIILDVTLILVPRIVLFSYFCLFKPVKETSLFSCLFLSVV